MAIASKVVVSTAQLLRRVRLMITVGTALNETSWADDLTVVNGIGPKTQGRLQALGIETLGQLAAVDDDVEWLADGVNTSEARVRDWVKQAADLAERQSSDADQYLVDVQTCIGRPFDLTGWVEMVVSDAGVAKPTAIDLFAAPADHRRSRELAAALKAVAAERVGMVRLPDITAGDVTVLRAIERSLREQDELTADEIADLELIGDHSGFDFTGRAI